MAMKISVVIPTYRRPELLLRCIDALKKQVFLKHDFEIIVISDGADELTANVINSMTSVENLRYFPLAKKMGPAAARNLGWKISCAELIAFTDDDCIPDVDWLSNYWDAYLTMNLKVCAFTGRTIVPIPKIPTDYELNISNLETAEFITANCACTKTALKKVDGFDENFTMAWREDSDIQFRFELSGIPIIQVKNAVVTHPVRKATWGVSIKEERKGIFNALLFRKFPSLYRSKIESTPPWHYYAIVLLLLTIVISLAANLFWLAATAFVGWLLITGWFTYRRLSRTSKTFSHIAEMIVTSAVIPVLSIYYRLYGAWKYKTPLFP
jgi:GT2 family glycosyltransferase